MTLEEIKAAVEAGGRVCWSTRAYDVVKDSKGQWLIICNLNNHCIGLTWLDGVTMNGSEAEFFTL